MSSLQLSRLVPPGYCFFYLSLSFIIDSPHSLSPTICGNPIYFRRPFILSFELYSLSQTWTLWFIHRATQSKHIDATFIRSDRWSFAIEFHPIYGFLEVKSRISVLLESIKTEIFRLTAVKLGKIRLMTLWQRFLSSHFTDHVVKIATKEVPRQRQKV